MSDKATWIIGGASDCDVVIDCDTVSAHHCQLSWVAPVFVLEDLRSTNGTFVNGQRITSPTPVTRADEVLMGSQIPMPWPDSDIVGIRDIVTIGREPDNDIVFDFEMVSGYHAQLIVDGSRTFLADVGSTNGTAIGSPDRPVKRAEISTKDTVYLGSYAIPARELLDKASRRQQNSRRRGQLQDFVKESVSIAKTVAPTPSANWPVQLRDPRVVAAATIGLSILLALVIFNRPSIGPATPLVPPENRRAEATSTPTTPVKPVPSSSQNTASEETPKEGTVPAEQPRMKSLNEIMERNRKAILWVGVRVEVEMGSSYLFPCYTAWACSMKPKVVISTARAVSYLEEQSKKPRHKVVAYQDGDEIPVVEFRLHPKYDAANPTSPTSIEHDIGALVLQFATPERCDVTKPSAIHSLSPGASLSVVGYTSKVPANRLESDPTYDEANDKYDGGTAQLLRSASPGSKSVYTLSIGDLIRRDSRLLIEGAPVFNESGHVVGVLVPNRTTDTRLVTTSLLSALFPNN